MRSLGSVHASPLDPSIRAVKERNMALGNKVIKGMLLVAD